MFGIGTILSKTVKIVTVPLDVAESVLDVATGGDGSKRSKEGSGIPRISELRDGACEALEDLDD